ncbi:MAG: cytochrome c oxidase assembly protein, partial [Mycobacteriales bacterium]
MSLTPRRAAALAGALAVVGIVTLSPLARRAQVNMGSEVVAFALLLYLAGPLLAGAFPLGAGRVLRGRGAWALALSGPLLIVLLTLTWFFTPWLDWTVHHLWVRLTGDALLLGFGWAVAVAVARVLAGASDRAYPVLGFISFVELLLDMVPGMLLTFDSHSLVGPIFHSRHFGGELLWALAEVMDLPYMLLLAVQWMRADA